MSEEVTNIQIDPNDWEVTPEKIRELILTLHSWGNQSLTYVEQLRGQIHELELQIKEKSQIGDFTRLLCSLASIRPCSQKEVVFVCDYPITRQAKLGWALRQIGWRVILLYKDLKWFDWKLYFDSAFKYRDENEAALLASQFSPTAFHCFSSWDFKTSAAIVGLAPGKVVFDNYDYFAGLLKPVHLEVIGERLELERFCVENSTGLCCRGLTLKVSEAEGGYKPKGKKVMFSDYAWNDPKQELLPKRTDGIHAVYVGGIEPKYFKDPEKFYSVVDIELIRNLSNKQIHYHLYPFTTSPKDLHLIQYEEYYKESRDNPYFHLHDPVPVQDLVKEISQYHFGLLSISEKARIEGDWSYHPQNARKVVFNKFFDYLDADLIPVSYGWTTMERICRGSFITAERSQVPSVLEECGNLEFINDFIKKMRTIRTKLSLVNQVHRLTKFYNSL